MKTAKNGQRMTNKTALVLDHLQKKKTITSWEAIELFGATRLSAIIYNLRKNYCINSVDKIFTDKHGDTSTFTEYVYCGELAPKE
jgi:hypothetical protein